MALLDEHLGRRSDRCNRMFCTSRKGRGRRMQCRRLDGNFLCQWRLPLLLLLVALLRQVVAMLLLLMVLLPVRVAMLLDQILLVLAATTPRLRHRELPLRHPPYPSSELQDVVLLAQSHLLVVAEVAGNCSLAKAMRSVLLGHSKGCK